MQLPLFSSLCISVTSLAPLPPAPAPPFQQLQSVALISLSRLLTNSSSPHGINYRPQPGSSAFSFLFSSSFSSQAPPSSFLSSPFPFYPPSKAELFLLLLCLLKSSSSAFPSYFSSSLTNQSPLSSPLFSSLSSRISLNSFHPDLAPPCSVSMCICVGVIFVSMFVFVCVCKY